MKTISLLLMALLSVIVTSAQDTLVLSSEIKRVTVFTKAAQILREGEITLPEGRSVLKLVGLSPDMDPKSIQIKVNDEVLVLSVLHQLKKSTEANSDRRIDSLAKIIRSITISMRTLNTRLEVINRKNVLLDDNTDLNNSSAAYSIDQLEKALVVYENTLMKSESEKLSITLKLDSLRQVIAGLQEQINVINGTPSKFRSEINIVMKTTARITVPVELTYIVLTAGWYPRYDIRAKDINHPVSITYKADVYQQTGESWKDVKLKFSTGSPFDRQTAPELPKWSLDVVRYATTRRINYYVDGIRVVTGVVRDEQGNPLENANINVHGHLLGTQSDVNGNFSIDLPPNANSIIVEYDGYKSQNVMAIDNDILVSMSRGLTIAEQIRNMPVKSINAISATTAGLSESNSKAARAAHSNLPQVTIQPMLIFENQTTVEFELDNTATILSDGKISNLELKQYDLKAEYTYECVPKADLSAYLIATITDWEECHLLEGEANLYFNNTYIGKTILNPDLISDTLEISLGRDSDIVMKRIKAEEFTKKTFLGTNSIVEKSFRISVRNKKLSPVKLIITDQIPVSVNESVTVTPVQLTNGLLNTEDGSVRWDIVLGEGESKEMMMNYSVKYPSREKVMLE